MKSHIVIKGAFFQGIAQVLVKIIQIIFRSFLSRYGTEFFGMYNVYIGVYASFVSLLTPGTSYGLSYFIADKSDSLKKKEYFGASVLYSLVFLTVVVLLLYSPLQQFLHLNDVIKRYKEIFLIAVIGGGVIALSKGYFSGRLSTTWSAFIDIAEALIKVIFVTILLFFSGGILSVVLGTTLGSVITATIAGLFLYKEVRTPIFSRKKIMEFSSFTIPITVSELLFSLSRYIEIVFILQLTSVPLFGIYSAGISISSFVLLVPQMLLSLYLPIITKIKNNDEQIRIETKTILFFVITITLWISTYLLLFTEETVVFLFGSQYLGAVVTTRIMTVAHVLYISFTWCNRIILDAKNKTKSNLLITMVRLVLYMVSLLLFVPKYGIMGGAISYILGVGIEAIISSFFVWKETKYIIDIHFLTKIFGSLSLAFVIYKGMLFFQVFDSAFINKSVVFLAISCLLFLVAFSDKRRKEFFRSVVRIRI